MWSPLSGVMLRAFPPAATDWAGNEIRHRLVCKGEYKTWEQDSFGHNIILPLCILAVVEGLDSCGREVRKCHALNMLAGLDRTYTFLLYPDKIAQTVQVHIVIPVKLIIS
jgi:hypothetical protein